MDLRRSATPLVSESEESRMRSKAKMESLCHSLELTHSEPLGSRDGPDPRYISGLNCTRKLREAMTYASTGSWFVDRLDVKESPTFQYRSLTSNKKYVDRYVDGWTRSGTPHMWQGKKWVKS